MAWREKESQKVNHAVLKKEGEKSYWDGKFIKISNVESFSFPQCPLRLLTYSLRKTLFSSNSFVRLSGVHLGLSISVPYFFFFRYS